MSDISVFYISVAGGLLFGAAAYICCKLLIWWYNHDNKGEKR